MSIRNSDLSNCTVVVNSCDKYSEAWLPFFELLTIFWPNCSYDVVLNTESIKYNFTKNQINVRTINSPSANESWSLRLKDVLLKIETDFVIVLLEDFFLQSQVRQDEINKCLNWMEADQDIAAFYFKKITGFETPSEKYTGYIEMVEDLKYKFNCQAAVWNRKALIAALGDNQSPWEFETEESLEKNRFNRKFYCINWDSKFNLHENDIFPYLFRIETGYGIWRSKWLWNNSKLFSKHKIPVNFRLGTYRKSEFLFLKWKSNSRIIIPMARKLGFTKLVK